MLLRLIIQKTKAKIKHNKSVAAYHCLAIRKNKLFRKQKNRFKPKYIQHLETDRYAHANKGTVQVTPRASCLYAD